MPSSRAMWTAKLQGGAVASKSDAAAIERELAARRTPFTGMVLGIDPSLRGTGLALVRFEAGAGKLQGSRTLKLKARLSQADCLGEIARAVGAVLDGERVDCVALEQTIYVQNFQTAQIMGMARGAVVALAAMRALPVHEYAPLRIKQAVVGYGRASKAQVAATVRQHLALAAELPSDESDAAAAALCHAFTGPRA